MNLDNIAHNIALFDRPPYRWQAAENNSPAADRAREVMEKKAAPLKAEIAQAEKHEAGFAGAKRIAQHAKKLMDQGHSEHMAFLKARAALPGAASSHDEMIQRTADAAEKKKASDDQKRFAAKVYALMESAKIPYREAYLQLKHEAPE